MTRSVLHVSQPVEAGVPKLVLDLARDQQARGWDVTVAAPGPLAAVAEEAGLAAARWDAGRSPGPTTLRETVALERLIRRVDPALVHLHSSKAGLTGRLALRGGVPTAFQPHAWSFDAVAGAVQKAALAWERLAARWTHAIVCVSEAERARGEEVGIRGPYYVIPIGLDFDAWRPAGDEERAAARERLGLGGGPLAVNVGRLSRQKGQDVLLAAWPRVEQRVPGAHLVLVGEGPDGDALRAAAPRSARLVGARDDVRDWLAAADVVVVSSRWEGLSYVLLEALASGRSVVSTDVAGAREALGEEGAVVPLENTDLLAAAVAERLLDRGRADAEGRNGRLRAESRFGFHRTADETARLYERLLGAQ